ncbi:MAG: hypothetical protein K1X88_26685 [Nannocystaceae bacterium]|nr:hypothetical protein [Nannocystaceae bacterium]
MGQQRHRSARLRPHRRDWRRRNPRLGRAGAMAAVARERAARIARAGGAAQPRRLSALLLCVWACPACGPTRVVDGSSAGGESTSAATARVTDDSAANGTGADASGETSGDAPSAHATSVAAGGTATCASSDAGLVRCWGRTVEGSPTIGDDEHAALAPWLPFNNAVTSLSMGYESHCAIVGAGEVTCWGRADDGLLGYGDTKARPLPTDDVVALPGAAVAVSVEGCACVLLAGGSVQCWGPRGSGIAGAGGVWPPSLCNGSCFYPECCIGDDEEATVLPPVAVGAEVAAISVGGSTVCVVTPDGRVRNWGSGRDGRLGFGLGSDEDLGDDEVPSSAPDVEIGGAAVAVAAGYPSCALLDDGTLRCWGGAASGYATNEIVGDDESPASMGAVPLPTRVVAIDASDRSVCALLDGGAVHCWGANDFGQLGLGHTETIGDDETPLDAGPVDLGGPAVAISVGMAHACAILDDGTIRCWGNNDMGQLGYGHTDAIGDDETPASAGPVPWLP